MRDFTASVVVFLVALPLCMGIAVASGVPAEKGLITGIIGGIVVGALAGSPLQVSGPAAGLAVIVFEVVQRYGLAMLGPILVVAGLIQLGAGALRLGQWFRAISPAVVHGMLAGIGLLIVAGQAHVLFGDSPGPHGLQNLLAIPAAFASLNPTDLGVAEATFLVGAITIAAMLIWEKVRPAKLKLVPGALLGVLAATLAAIFFQLPVQRIAVPESIIAAIAPPGAGDLARLMEPAIFITALAIAFIASAETLLSAAAVDQMHSGPKTRYNKELAAQGIGNLLCGLAGALPMTGVIVRSSANVQAGAQTRLSTILHGIWILGSVALLASVLRLIPSAALAGVLVVTGWRLVSLKHARHLFERYGLLPTAIWAVTFFTVVATDLLTGVLVGMALTLVELAPNLMRLRLRIQTQTLSDDEREVSLDGAATFVQLPRIAKALEASPRGGMVRLNLERLSTLDHTCAEVLTDWLRGRERDGGRVELRANETVRRRLIPAHA
ncbi:SulP family inorganic anion transporter [Caulobacter sp. NIBR2454]|uniref:SulP family inorganic anion transporter n=1 Tax=Caulobacter sp. NIBR2454 TaxID=3015996 RepID=UPI0022B68187|nr:SulP family inorganic anion transporter [Caulobacter sp. NIBR2454]